jgi:hypothetical protein
LLLRGERLRKRILIGL